MTTTLADSDVTLPVLDDAGRAALFTEARTANTFSDTPVSDETLAAVWELAKWPPTAANTQPLRVTFVRTEEGKQRLLPLLSEGNRAKTEAAPAVAILAADLDFHEFVPKTFPARAEMKETFEASGREGREQMARFNSTLQIGYFLLAARPRAGHRPDGRLRPRGRHDGVLPRRPRAGAARRQPGPPGRGRLVPAPAPPGPLGRRHLRVSAGAP
ncbi:hypothetical protein GCM10009836_07970 [Pseudonocardia ailaonensis]|uniref:Nitroreductase domain-containing protein n=1 Tax=Pseudonocardia ailaonensis TaxID=367279 RepID=A0ABN2MMF6_9PSEU